MRVKSGVRIKSVFCVLCSVFCALSLLGCYKKDSMYRESRMIMDTICTITVVSPSEREAKAVIDAGFEEISKIETLINYFSPESEIAAINKSAGIKAVKVSRETLDIIKRAVEIAEATNGAFDPAIGPLTRLWGFSAKTVDRDVPRDEDIKNILPLIDYKKIRINTEASEIFLEKKGMELELGGVAKGYAADKAMEAVKTKGAKAALIAIAGDIKGFGLKPDGKAWKVGIQNPRIDLRVKGQVEAALREDSLRGSGVKEEEDILAALYLKDTAISTSGDYQRFFIKDGKRYHHIINPKTGYPASGVISVSVIAPEGYTTDGFSTGVFVLGAEEGISLLESLGIGGVIVDDNMEVILTKDLKGKINIEKNF
ncbi:MAG: FAD:protein FMN transferase [Nitrospirae bacterium]|nr:FAD:protein FMN transferase [Nitrospirota bacterium]